MKYLLFMEKNKNKKTLHYVTIIEKNGQHWLNSYHMIIYIYWGRRGRNHQGSPNQAKWATFPPWFQ